VADDCRLEIQKNRDISIMLWPTAAKFGKIIHFDIPQSAHYGPLKFYLFKSIMLDSIILNIKLHGCIVWNAHYTVLGSKRLAICATV